MQPRRGHSGAILTALRLAILAAPADHAPVAAVSAWVEVRTVPDHVPTTEFMTLDVRNQFLLVLFRYTQREPNKKPLRPINRLPRTDRYKKTAYNRLF